jgi:hypothetical protein
MRTFLLAARLRQAHVKSVNLHTAPPDLFLRDDLDASDRLERVEGDRSEVFNRYGIPDGALLGRSTETERAHGVVRCELESIYVLAETKIRASFAAGKKRLARQQPNSGNLHSHMD